MRLVGEVILTIPTPPAEKQSPAVKQKLTSSSRQPTAVVNHVAVMKCFGVALVPEGPKDFDCYESLWQFLSCFKHLGVWVITVVFDQFTVIRSLNVMPAVAGFADDATCGTPTWIGKGLTCVCFKRKGHYERICINLTPHQASYHEFHEMDMQEPVASMYLSLTFSFSSVWFVYFNLSRMFLLSSLHYAILWQSGSVWG